MLNNTNNQYPDHNVADPNVPGMAQPNLHNTLPLPVVSDIAETYNDHTAAHDVAAMRAQIGDGPRATQSLSRIDLGPLPAATHIGIGEYTIAADQLPDYAAKVRAEQAARNRGFRRLGVAALGVGVTVAVATGIIQSSATESAPSYPSVGDKPAATAGPNAASSAPSIKIKAPATIAPRHIETHSNTPASHATEPTRQQSTPESTATSPPPASVETTTQPVVAPAPVEVAPVPAPPEVTPPTETGPVLGHPIKTGGGPAETAPTPTDPTTATPAP